MLTWSRVLLAAGGRVSLCLALFVTSARFWKGGGSFHDGDTYGGLFSGPPSMCCSHLSQIVVL